MRKRSKLAQSTTLDKNSISGHFEKIKHELIKDQWCSQGLPGWASREIEEENEQRLRKYKKKLSRFEEK